MPTIPAIRPWSMESWPSDGPTVRSSMIRSGAGRAPALRTSARSEASDICEPRISMDPRFRIRPSTEGALTTSPSSTIAIRSFMWAGGDLLEGAAAEAVEFEDHLGLVELGVPGGGGLLQLVAGQEGTLLEHEELVIEAAGLRHRVHPPLQADVPRQRSLELVEGQVDLDLFDVLFVDVVADHPRLSVGSPREEKSREGTQQVAVLLFGLCRRVGGGLRIRSGIGCGAVAGLGSIIRFGEEEKLRRKLLGLLRLGFRRPGPSESPPPGPSRWLDPAGAAHPGPP